MYPVVFVYVSCSCFTPFRSNEPFLRRFPGAKNTADPNGGLKAAVWNIASRQCRASFRDSMVSKSGDDDYGTKDEIIIKQNAMEPEVELVPRKWSIKHAMSPEIEVALCKDSSLDELLVPTRCERRFFFFFWYKAFLKIF